MTEYTAGWRYRYEYTVDISVTVIINNATGSELSQVLDAVVLAGGNVLQIQDIKVRSLRSRFKNSCFVHVSFIKCTGFQELQSHLFSTPKSIQLRINHSAINMCPYNHQ